MKLKSIFTIGCLMLFAFTSCQESQLTRISSFNDSWLFKKGEISGAETSDFTDTDWRQLDLPHDWAIEGPFDSTYNARCGGLPYHGIAWYRNHFIIPNSAKGKDISITFDGAMANSQVWLNGHKVGERPYGYIGFQVDLTPHLKYGRENVLAIRLAPEDYSSRWYPGAGIYRNVWLNIKNPVHVGQWGIYITTPKVSNDKAIVKIETKINNREKLDRKIIVRQIIISPDGSEVARVDNEHLIPGHSSFKVLQEITINRPQRWDIADPDLYIAKTLLMDENKIVDQCETTFGIRTIEFKSGKGFSLNGRQMKLKGVCLHHDLGPLGAAVNRRATERQLEIMKAMGVNAIRTSHNPPSPEQLEFCDKLGLLVMVEAFDCWKMAKVPNGYNKYFEHWYVQDLKDMIYRDRNHPSVIMWSIGNEILEQGKSDGWKLARELTRICHEEDASRPVTAGFNNYPGAIENRLTHEVDIVGLNYKPAFYEEVIKEHKDWIVLGSETASCVSSRGIYHLPLEKYQKHPSLQVTSYDIIGPPWAYPPDVEFYFKERFPEVLGEFVWTGFDYLGEPTPYGWRTDYPQEGYWNADWPSRSSYFGCVDLCGFPKDRYYLYQSVWTDNPMIHVLPHWNWKGKEGEKIPVYCYTNCDEAELLVNGKSVGRQKRFKPEVEIPVSFRGWEENNFSTKYRRRWDVPYEPGSLKIIGYVAGKLACEKEIKTAGEPAKIALLPDRTEISADGKDLSFITVRIEDEIGTLCPRANNLVNFRLNDVGEIAAVGNGNAATIEPFQASYRRAFNGLCMLIIRSRKNNPGTIQVEAFSEGLQSALTSIQAL